MMDPPSMYMQTLDSSYASSPMRMRQGWMDGINEKHTRLVWLNYRWSECLFCERQVSVPKICPKFPECFVTTLRLAHRVCCIGEQYHYTTICTARNASRNVFETIS